MLNTGRIFKIHSATESYDCDLFIYFTVSELWKNGIPEKICKKIMPDYLRSVKVNPTHLCRIHVTFQQALSFENPRRAMNITICSISVELLACVEASTRDFSVQTTKPVISWYCRHTNFFYKMGRLLVFYPDQYVYCIYSSSGLTFL